MPTFTQLEAARKQVTVSAEILSSTPVISGTRIPVHDVAASVAAGATIEELLEAYPTLNAEQIQLAEIYAAANPLPQKPKVPSISARPEATIVSERRVPRP